MVYIYTDKSGIDYEVFFSHCHTRALSDQPGSDEIDIENIYQDGVDVTDSFTDWVELEGEIIDNDSKWERE